MTKPLFLKTLLFLFVIIVGGILSDRYFFGHKINRFGPLIIEKPASYLFAKLEGTRFFLRSLAGIRGMIAENEQLEKENFALISQLADYDDLKNENDFLRKALSISPRFNNEIAYGNIFYFQFGANGYDVLLTEGTNAGINDNDIVITEEGVLVGRIERSYENFARVLAITDPDFSVTVKVLNSNTAGIAWGALAQGLLLDLIVQSDSIVEGEVIVSNGMDFFPSALVVGTVSHVETNETDLFKKVKIKPAIEDVKIGRVLIIRKN